MLFDFEIFYAAGQAVLAGESPYRLADYFYPPPAAYYFALWSALPFQVALIAWGAGMLGILWLVARRTLPMWLLFPPVFAQFFSGQVDLYVLGLWYLVHHATADEDGRLPTAANRLSLIAHRRSSAGTARAISLKRYAIGQWRSAVGGHLSALALAMMTLKPQLAVWLVPYTLWQWRAQRPKLLTFAAATMALWGLPAAIHPDWYGQWLRGNLPVQAMMIKAPTAFGLTGFGLWLWPVAGLLAVLVLWWAWPRGREVFAVAGLGVNPSIQPYNYAFVVQPRFLWRTVLAGWIAWLSYLILSEPRTYFIVPLVAVWEMTSRRTPMAEGN